MENKEMILILSLPQSCQRERMSTGLIPNLSSISKKAFVATHLHYREK